MKLSTFMDAVSYADQAAARPSPNNAWINSEAVSGRAGGGREIADLGTSRPPRGPGNGLGRGIAGPRERDQTIRHLVGKLPVIGRPIARGPNKFNASCVSNQ